MSIVGNGGIKHQHISTSSHGKTSRPTQARDYICIIISTQPTADRV